MKRPPHGLQGVSHPSPDDARYTCACGEVFYSRRKISEHLRAEGALKRGQKLLHWTAYAELNEPGRMCEWFALCDREADGVLPHSILGDVPCCKRCAAQVGAEDELRLFS